MKWLSSGLTFVNAATVLGLLLGMAAGGLNRGVTLAAVILAAIVAFFAWSTTCRSSRQPDTTASPSRRSAR